MTSATSTTLPPAVRTRRRTYVEHVMGLPISIVLRGSGVDESSGVKAFFTELRTVDEMFSTYRDDSQISRLRRNELRIDQCDPDVPQVLDRCGRATRDTGGLFDCHLPELDPSGLVKGWAIERASRHLLRRDIDFCVNAGGDVLARCLPGRQPWRVGIEDPLEPTRVLAVVDVTDGAVATSGTAARGSHLVDPRTGQPAVDVASVTVWGASLERADVLATAAFVSGAEAAGWIEQFDGYAALVVGLDGAIATSSGWPQAPAAS